MDLPSHRSNPLDIHESETVEGGYTVHYYDSMFEELKYGAWMAYGLLSIISFRYYSFRLHELVTMKSTASPIGYHTFYGYSELIRVAANVFIWFGQAFSWAFTMIPFLYFHTMFIWVSKVTMMATILKWFSLLFIKGASFLADNYTRDYEPAEDVFVMKMFPDGTDVSTVWDYMLEIMGLLGQLTV